MRFWKLLWTILSYVMIRRDITMHNINSRDLKVIHVCIMPWAVAFTIGDIIITTYDKKEWRKKEHILYHELIHVKQWDEHGFWFPFKYFWSSFKALFSGKKPFKESSFEAPGYRAQERMRLTRTKKDKKVLYDELW